MSVLIWVQTVGQGYQQMTKVTASKERVKTKLKGKVHDGAFLDL